LSPATGRWLQGELRRRLMLPLLAIIALTGALSGFSAHALVEEVFDGWLLDAARSLAAQVRFVEGRAVIALSPQSEAVLTYDVVDRVSYEVTQDGAHLIGQHGLPTQGNSQRSYGDATRAFDATYVGRAVRVGQVPVHGPAGALAMVAVSETRTKRERALAALLLVLSPVAVLVLAGALVIAVAARRTIVPLERMAALWNERSHASFAPMSSHDVPRELMPFADALNDLLARVRDLVLRERQFAATAAHQLRTPLTGLQLGLARAARCPDLPTTRAAISELAASTQRAARVVQQLLALSRLDPAARGEIALTPLDLVPLTREVGEAFMDAAQRRNIELSLETQARAVLVPGQRDLLSDALGNLLDNAIQYTPAGGAIVLTVSATPPSVSVADSGTGIADDDRERVFERFVRGHGTAGEGTGLGLAIVREIASLHRAEVVLDAAPGLQGARFTLLFGTGTDAGTGAGEPRPSA
jgi:two-component system sensor histidine kinase TctE